MTRKSLLVILDGWGLGSIPTADALYQAQTPFIDELIRTRPQATLVSYGMEVGLPEGQMGNSEVGHLNIGAGRIVYQELARINKAITDKSLGQEIEILKAIKLAKEKGATFHLMGLLSDGGVHSHIEHMIELSRIITANGVSNLKVHAFMDGRDTDPQGGANFIEYFNERLAGINVEISTLIGRYYAMDRDHRWERVKKAYDLLVRGEGTVVNDLTRHVRQAYLEGITDEFMTPFIKDKNAVIKNGDIVLFANFRTDRPRQLTHVLTQGSIAEYDMLPLNLHYITMTEYDESYKNVNVVYKKDKLSKTMGEVISAAGLSQLRIAETEKYPHVTFFFSGGREESFQGESRVLIPSPKVATYDLKPEMSAQELTAAAYEKIITEKPDFICLNYANTDMVGHTGDFSAAMKAAETVDSCLKRLVNTASGHGYEILIIADHGNSDFMINPDGSPNTAHTTNPVPIIYVSPDNRKVEISSGKLADVAPTLLHLMNLDIPAVMTGKILIKTESPTQPSIATQKTKSWLHYSLIGLFGLFALVQYDDPDWYIWIPIYATAIISAVLFLQKNKHAHKLALLSALIIFSYAVRYVPEVNTWLKMGAPTITGTMKAENAYIENVREFLGLLLTGFANLWYFIKGRT